jgi:hypothetical protein
MAEGDRPEDDESPRPRRRRRKPPVLELEAKEVSAEGQAKSRQRDAQRSQRAGSDFSKRWTESLTAGNWLGLAASPAVAAMGGLLFGGLIVYAFVVLRVTPSDPQVGALKNDIADLAARVESLATRPPAATFDPGALVGRIDRLTAAIGEADKRLAAIEQRPAPQPSGLSDVNTRTAAIESAIKDLHAALADVRKLAEQAPPAASAVAIESLASRIGGLEQRIASLAAARAAASGASLATEIVSLNALADAVRSGRPFVRELETVRARLGGRAGPLATLDAHAERGLPTTAALAERFATVVPEIMRGPEPDGGFLSRLYANAIRLVEVRPVGEPKGESVGAIVARMETRLGRGDLGGALAESDALPRTAKSIAASWLAAAQQRRDAEEAVKRLIDDLLANHTERERP